MHGRVLSKCQLNDYRSIFFIFFLAFSCTLDIIFSNLLRSSRVYTWRGFLVQRYEAYFIEISWFLISYYSHHCFIKTPINVETLFVAGHKEIHFAKPYVVSFVVFAKQFFIFTCNHFMGISIEATTLIFRTFLDSCWR